MEPVVAARVGGLSTAVRDGVTGLLVDGHDPRDWAATLEAALEAPAVRDRMAQAAVEHARTFSWDATVSATLGAYARAGHALPRLRAWNAPARPERPVFSAAAIGSTA